MRTRGDQAWACAEAAYQLGMLSMNPKLMRALGYGVTQQQTIEDIRGILVEMADALRSGKKLPDALVAPKKVNPSRRP